MISELPFKFRNVGTLSSSNENVKAAASLVIEDLFCMTGEVKIKIHLSREADRRKTLQQRQSARAQNGGQDPLSLENGIGELALMMPRGVQHDEKFLLKHCFIEELQEALKLWEVVVFANRLRLNFCDLQGLGRDKHNVRASVEFENRLTLEGKFRAESFKNDSPSLLRVRYGDDAAPGWGNFVDVATGTAEDGIVQAKFYPEANVDLFDRITRAF